MTPSPPIQDSPPVTSVAIQLNGAPFEITANLVSGAFHPIPLSLWSAIIGFHRAITLRMGGESVSYHRWHSKTQQYHSLIPYQYTRIGGLSVSTPWEDPRNRALLDGYGVEFKEDFMSGVATVHTHCDVCAFESGTDAKDEQSLPGFHITLGKLKSFAAYDLDFRLRIPHTPKIRALTPVDSAYEINWTNLFPEGTKKDDIFKIPGSLAWADKIPRVIARSNSLLD